MVVSKPLVIFVELYLFVQFEASHQARLWSQVRHDQHSERQRINLSVLHAQQAANTNGQFVQFTRGPIGTRAQQAFQRNEHVHSLRFPL